MLAPRIPLLALAMAVATAAASAAASASVPAIILASPIDQLAGADLPPKLPAGRLTKALHSAAKRILLVISIDDGLSLGDFARYGYGDASWAGTPFANVAALSAKLGGRHLLVSDAGELEGDLRDLVWSGGAPTAVSSADGIAAAVAAASTTGSWLLTARAADAAAADRLLGAACELMQARGLPFIAVFTASKPSVAAAEAAAAAGRHLLAVAAAPTADPSKNGTFVNCQNSILLYYQSLTVNLTVNSNQKFSVSIPRVDDGSALIDAAKSLCNVTGGNRSLTLTYPPPGLTLPTPLKSLSLTLNFLANSRSFWQVGSASASIGCVANTSANCAEINAAAVGAKSLTGFGSPNGTCYHCTSGAVLRTDGNATLSLAFAKLQFQPFGALSKSGGFSDSVNDCVGFFSVEVWFTLLVLVVVTVILMYGVLMLLSVATPDRFDDPKGKTIQINVQEGGN